MPRAIARVIDETTEQPQQPEQFLGPRRTVAKPVATVLPTELPFSPYQTMQITEQPGQVPQISLPPERQTPTTRLERAAGVGEIALQGITGGIGTALGGISGLAAAVGGAGSEQAAQNVEEVEKLLTYEPRGRGAAEAMEALEYGVEKAAPVVGPVVKGFQTAKDVAAEKLGPAAGAAVGTLPTAIAELAALKISRKLRRKLTKKLLNEANPAELVDDMGHYKPEVEAAIEQADLDLNDIKEFSQKGMEKQAGEVGKTVSSTFTKKSRTQRLAEQAQPDPEIVKAAEEFGLLEDMLTSHTTKDATHAAVVQGLRSIPGSKLAERERRLLENVGRQADQLIQEFGGTTDKTTLSDAYRIKARETIDNIKKAENLQFAQIERQIKQQAKASGLDAAPVEASNVLAQIEEREKALGAEKYLTRTERYLKRSLLPDENPTYDRLEDLRQQIGDALERKGGSTIFTNVSEARLKALYGALAQDQKVAAAKYGVGDLYDSARQMTISRKGIEKQLIQTMGKELTGNITQKAKKAILDLGKKDTKAWDELSANIPKELGADQRREIFATALNDAFVGQSSRGGRAISVRAFDDFMGSLTRNEGAARRLAKEIGQENYQRLQRFHTIVGGIRRGMDQTLHTGKIMSVPGIVDDIQTITQRIYGKASEGARRVPVMKTILGELPDRTPKSIAADELLDSPQFRNAVFSAASGKLDTPEKIQKANRMLEASKAFQNWATTLEKGELKELAAVGAIGYLTGQAVKETDQETED